MLDTAVREALRSPSADGLSSVVELLRAEFLVERVSIAAIDDERRSFRIVAASGRNLFAAGSELPISASTQIQRTAAREVFAARNFACEPGFELPADRLVCATGFRSGCSVPLQAEDRLVGAVSLSAARVADHGSRVKALQAIGPLLAGALAAEQTPPEPTSVLLCHGDGLAGEEAGTERVGVVLCDGDFDRRSLDALVLELRRVGVSAPVVVVPTRDTSANGTAALRVGVVSYTSRSARARSIARALEVASRDSWARPIRVSEAPTLHLTGRERELLIELDRGPRLKQIALRMGITESTVKGYSRSLYRKLGAHSRSEAVYEARSRGLLGSPL